MFKPDDQGDGKPVFYGARGPSVNETARAICLSDLIQFILRSGPLRVDYERVQTGVPRFETRLQINAALIRMDKQESIHELGSPHAEPSQGAHHV